MPHRHVTAPVAAPARSFDHCAARTPTARLSLLAAALALSACGAEVAPAAAALATRQASQAEEGRRQVEAVQGALVEAAKAREAAASEALEAAR